MSMRKISNVAEWDIAALPAEAPTSITIHFAYPDLIGLRKIAPKERVKAINAITLQNIDSVVALGDIKAYKAVPNKRRPRAMKAEVPFDACEDICALPAVESLSIDAIAGIKRKKSRPVRKRLTFFCIKMTVAIERENAAAGLQMYEERYVIVRADSGDDAYSRIEKTREKYAEPYLNADGYLVRWRIESLDACYETRLEKVSEFAAPQGVEVFSTLKMRRLTPERRWDGN